MVKILPMLTEILLQMQTFDDLEHTSRSLNACIYSITCMQRPLKESNESGLLQQVVFECRSYQVDLRTVVVSEQWSLKADGLLIQVVSNTGLTVP